jgi:hypothetical protein
MNLTYVFLAILGVALLVGAAFVFGDNSDDLFDDLAPEKDELTSEKDELGNFVASQPGYVGETTDGQTIDADFTTNTEGTTNDETGTVGTGVSGQEEVQNDGIRGESDTHN